MGAVQMMPRVVGDLNRVFSDKLVGVSGFCAAKIDTKFE